MKKRILVIDDDPDLLEILGIIFEGEGFDVVLSETGDEADDIPNINPDLVILDLMLRGSGKNGAEICYQIKSRPEMLNLPVILCSSEDNIAEISKQCKANGYVKKPFDVDYLMEKIREMLAA